MKKILIGLLILFACTPEDKVDPAHASTFVRYFNGGNSDEAKQVLQTLDNGFIILATTTIKPSELESPFYKIKLIKTDAFGNQQWQKFYPEFGGETKNYRGNSIQLLPDGGYVIAGDDIQNDLPKMMILRVDSEGNMVGQRTIKSTFPITGLATSVNKDGDFLALGYIQDGDDNKNMVLAKFNKTNLDSTWSSGYGAGQGTLAPRLFLDNQSNAFWGGTIQKNNSNSAIRFVKVIADAKNMGAIDFDLPLTNPQYIETGNDFCRFGSGFAVIGTTNQKGTAVGDLDILFKRVTADGTELASKSFPIGDQQQNETGNSICSTADGGFLLLGTIDTQGDIGRGDKDYYLIKINAFGSVEWTQNYGSKFEDIGVNVIQANDNGYVVLGTSNLGRVKTVMLMKTDKNGKIE